MRPSRLLPALAALLLGLLPPAVATGERLPGPVPAQVMAVIDGDTLVVKARIWLGQAVETRVRLADIDTPALRAPCDSARLLAVRARDLVLRLAGDGEVTLHDVRLGKYAGRVIARVVTADGSDLGAALLAAGLAHDYDGGRKRRWCTTPPVQG